MNSYKHPISRYLNPQATHLSTLLFFGYIFWQAFKPNKKQNPAARYNEELVEIVYNSIMDWLNDLEESDPVFFEDIMSWVKTKEPREAGKKLAALARLSLREAIVQRRKSGSEDNEENLIEIIERIQKDLALSLAMDEVLFDAEHDPNAPWNRKKNPIKGFYMTEEYEQKLKEESQIFDAKAKLADEYLKDMEIVDYSGLLGMHEILEGLMYDFNVDKPEAQKQLKLMKKTIQDAYQKSQEFCDYYNNRKVTFDPVERRKQEAEYNKLAEEENDLAEEAHINMVTFMSSLKKHIQKVYPKQKKNPLNINKKMKRWLEGQGDRLLGVIDIGPLEFVQLTTKGAHGFYHIWKTAKDLEFYNSEEINDDMCVHPFVYVDEDGTIRGHEGRNRAVATFKNGESTFKLAVIGSTGRVRKMPKQLINQYGTGFKVKI